jgi:Flp pilus assembly protein TadD
MEALAPADRLVKGERLDPEEYLLAGMAELDAGDALRAVESLRRAAFLDPRNVLAHFTLGRAYVQLGHLERARVIFLQTRRLLASAEEVPTLDGDGLTIDDLRYAVEVQLGQLGAADAD